MNDFQLAKSLQIAGVLVGTFIAGILLNREFLGSRSQKVLNKLNELSNTPSSSLIKVTLRMLLMHRDELPPGLRRQVFFAILTFFAWVLLVIASIFNIRLLLWVSVSFLGVYALWHIVDVLRQPKKQPQKTYSKKLLLFLLVRRLINGLIMFPIGDTLIYFSNRVVYFIFLVVESIVSTNRVRLILAFIGFILVFTGLLWELFLLTP